MWEESYIAVKGLDRIKNKDSVPKECCKLKEKYDIVPKLKNRHRENENKLKPISVPTELLSTSQLSWSCKCTSNNTSNSICCFTDDTPHCETFPQSSLIQKLISIDISSIAIALRKSMAKNEY